MNIQKLLYFISFALSVALYDSTVNASTPITADFSHITSKDGLPQNTVRATFQDHNSLIWFGTDDGLIRYDGYSLKTFRREANNSQSLTDSYVSAISEDKSGKLLIGTLGGGLHRMLSPNGEFEKLNIDLPDQDILDINKIDGENYIISTGAGVVLWDGVNKSQLLPLQIKGKNRFRVKKAILDSSGNYWLAAGNDGLLLYQPNIQKTQQFLSEETPVSTLLLGQDKRIWLGSEQMGLATVDLINDKPVFHFLNQENSNLPSNDVMSLAQTPEGTLLVGTWGGGLSYLNEDQRSFKTFRFRKGDSQSLISDLNMSLYADGNGHIWYGSYDKGLSHLDPSIRFTNIRPDGDIDSGLPSELIWSFAEGPEALWVGTAKGTTALHKNTFEKNLPPPLQQSKQWKEVAKLDARSLLLNKNHLWIGSKKNGLFRADLTSGHVQALSELTANNLSLENNSIRLLEIDDQDQLWIGTQKGLSKFNLRTGDLTNYPIDALPHYRIRALEFDSEKRLWVGTPSGLSLYQPQTDNFRHWHHDPKQPETTLAGPMVQAVAQDKNGLLWLGTSGGVTLFDPTSFKVLKNFRTSDEMPSNGVYGVIAGDTHTWASTMRGLAQINQKSLKVISYHAKDGLPDNEFNFNAFLKLKDTRLVLGTVNGLTLFAQKDTYTTPAQAPVLWQNFTVDDQPLSELKDTLSFENRLSIHYGVYHYGPKDEVLYKYAISGPINYESSWALDQQISYAHLPSGEYSIQVSAKNRHGKWIVNSSPITFSVLPPYYHSTSAYILYGVIVICLFGISTKLNKLRLEKRNKELERLLHQKASDLIEINRRLLEEKDKSKSSHLAHTRLIKGLTHELKTPLSTASSALQKICQNQFSEEAQLANSSLIKLNSLLSRLMELTHTEQQASSPNSQIDPIGQCQAIKVINQAVENYREISQSENKEIHSHCASGCCDDIYLNMPAEELFLCIGNLISNAIKYCAPKTSIHISCETSDGSYLIHVKDKGIGIHKDAQSKIWDWFIQENNEKPGWGVGLAFVKEAIESYGGKVSLKSSPGKGSTFTLHLPYSQGPIIVNTSELIEDISLLIVEDDNLLRQQLQSIFPSSWKIAAAKNSADAMEKLRSFNPDIILSDLMLPDEDGLAFVSRLRNSDQNFQSPVIMLTALEDPSIKQKAYDLSIDAFLTKPFDNDILIKRISGIVGKRRELMRSIKSRLLKSNIAAPENSNVDPNNFFEKLNDIVEQFDQMDDITIKTLAKHMAMSERTLQRRFEENGISWREYKTLTRIQRVMELLKTTDLKIAEIADQLDFSSPAHLSKVFKEHTGVSPSSWRKGSN